MKKISCLLLSSLLLYNTTSRAQQFRTLNSTQIFEKLHQLNNLTTVMYLAAHPDDENTRLLSYLTHHRNYNTIYLSLTRGEGGQNLIGTELGLGLGLIRNYELIAAREIDGAQQAFTSFIDFGFSKNPEETLQIWDRKALVAEVKQAIKKYRPDVIICRFPTTGEGGHGQHTTSAIVAKEAYESLQKEKYAHLPQRLLFNAFRFGDRNTIKESHFKIPTNQYNPLLGESYGEMAGTSRSIHRSQGAGTPQSIGIAEEAFELMAGEPIQHDIIDRDISWNRINRNDIEKDILDIINNYQFNAPHKSVDALIGVRKKIKKVEDTYWQQTKLAELDAIILSAAGIMGEVTTKRPEVLTGDTLLVNTQIIARYPEVSVNYITYPGLMLQKPTYPISLQFDSVYNEKSLFVISNDEFITQPYWLAKPQQNFQYTYDNQYFSLPANTKDFAANVVIKIKEETLSFQIPVSYKYLHPTKGDVVQATRIIPDIIITPTQTLGFYNNDEKIAISVNIQQNKALNKASFQLFSDQGELFKQDITLPTVGKDSNYVFYVPANKLKGKNEHQLLMHVETDNRSFYKSKHKIQYDHLPELVYYSYAQIKLVQKDWKNNAQKIGYINGAGDNIFNTLRLAGFNIELIPDHLIKNKQYLSQFDAIISGIRAYNTNESLVNAYDAIMGYIENGGNYIAQYNTTANLLTDKIGPYPFKISRDRVTDENAIVNFTKQQSSLLQYPNTISNKDFEKWVQERGLYFPTQLDSHYHTYITMNDPKEAPLEGGIIHTAYGKGNFIYTPLAFFRQIPNGHIGSIRLFTNLINAKKAQ